RAVRPSGFFDRIDAGDDAFIIGADLPDMRFARRAACDQPARGQLGIVKARIVRPDFPVVTVSPAHHHTIDRIHRASSFWVLGRLPAPWRKSKAMCLPLESMASGYRVMIEVRAAQNPFTHSSRVNRCRRGSGPRRNWPRFVFVVVMYAFQVKQTRDTLGWEPFAAHLRGVWLGLESVDALSKPVVFGASLST